MHPDRELSPVGIDDFIPHAIEWLHEKSFITAFVFHPPEDEHEISHLDGSIKEYEKGEIRINTISKEWYTLELGEHMESFAHLFDEFILVADDPVYVSPLRSVLPAELSDRQLGSHKTKYLANCKLLRHGNESTSYVGSELVHVLWQRVWYIIGASMGLSLYEM